MARRVASSEPRSSAAVPVRCAHTSSSALPIICALGQAFNTQSIQSKSDASGPALRFSPDLAARKTISFCCASESRSDRFFVPMPRMTKRLRMPPSLSARPPFNQ
eukprot:4891105-Prymnesium_polylepis.3